ncbi:type II toxin-antitoxin system PemK/MazF family toxin [Pediococcus pentosaceus]|uniref:type II toxin-antitoxin system PemK/MazF family toxin n=1 Tax=Pediococcus pentosaceus TaxID=1255 RepID=UPI002E3791EE|nr:type II toxin-antitoxin system PemK/MazF family toxin [Pediococcus pentosaceus]
MADEKLEKTSLLSEWYPEKSSLSNIAIDNREVIKYLRDTYSEQHSFPFFQKGIFWANLGENIGAEINKIRPVIILSKTQYNLSDTVVVAPLTTGHINRPFLLPYQYKLFQSKYPGLERDSIVKLDQIRTISVSRFKNNKADSCQTPLDEITPITIVNTQDWHRMKAKLKNLFSI